MAYAPSRPLILINTGQNIDTSRQPIRKQGFGGEIGVEKQRNATFYLGGKNPSSLIGRRSAEPWRRTSKLLYNTSSTCISIITIAKVLK